MEIPEPEYFMCSSDEVVRHAFNYLEGDHLTVNSPAKIGPDVVSSSANVPPVVSDIITPFAYNPEERRSEGDFLWLSRAGSSAPVPNKRNVPPWYGVGGTVGEIISPASEIGLPLELSVEQLRIEKKAKQAEGLRFDDAPFSGSFFDVSSSDANRSRRGSSASVGQLLETSLLKIDQKAEEDEDSSEENWTDAVDHIAGKKSVLSKPPVSSEVVHPNLSYKSHF